MCELSGVAGYESLMGNIPNLNNYYCIDKRNLTNPITLFGTYGDVNNGYSKFHIWISKCANSSIYSPNADKNTCASNADEEAVIKGLCICT